MNIESFLEEKADAPLRGTPAGDYVADLIEVAIDETVTQATQANALLEKVRNLPDHEIQGRVLYRTIPAGLETWDSWGQLTDTASNSPESKKRMRALTIVTVVITILTLVFGYIVLNDHVVNKGELDKEYLYIIFAPITIVCLFLLGIKVESIRSIFTLFGRK